MDALEFQYSFPDGTDDRLIRLISKMICEQKNRFGIEKVIEKLKKLKEPETDVHKFKRKSREFFSGKGGKFNFKSNDEDLK
jgi:hypothetical protein